MTVLEGIHVNKKAGTLNGISIGLAVSFVILSSFNAGMFVAIGVRHGSLDFDHARFLAIGCLSLLVAVVFGFLLAKRSNH
jgi:hypothetical protein